MAVETEVAGVVAGLQLLVAAQHRLERRLVELEQHRLARRLVVLVPRRQQADLRRPELRRLVDHPQLAPAALDRRRRALAAAGAAGVISPAAQTRMAPLIPDSPKWLAIPTACRR